jgi:ribosome-associated heat shock protein Hsp15
MAKAASVRVDKWLWAVRVFKTRSAANEACGNGRVRVNDEVAKPATKVTVGDVVSARRRDRTITYEVLQVLEKRVSAQLAAEAVDDLSPPRPESPPSSGEPAALSGVRDRGTGRPTKRERRQLERFRRR